MCEKYKKLFGIIALAAVIVFPTAGCDDGSRDSGGGSGNLGNTLNLSGRVYLMEEDETGFTFRNYTGGNLTVSSSGGGSGAVTNGNLNFSIGTPAGVDTIDLFEDLPNFDYHEYENLTPGTARGVVLYGLDIVGSPVYGGLAKGGAAYSQRNNGYSLTSEWVSYVYVENDVTISGTGRTETYERGTFTYTDTTRNFNLALKAGWNAVYQKMEGSYTVTEGTMENPIRTTETLTHTVSLSNPAALRWVLETDDDDYDGYSLMLNRSMPNAPETGNPGLKTPRQPRRDRLPSSQN
ncbi:MAG: hypothetical protein LBQ69_03470 [Treponema sp.]|nr:hypothetical protein [Treponema sp.]